MKEVKDDMTTEEQIFKVAEEEFLNNGYSKTKLSTIAKKAKVNHAMVHYYFRNKENLFNMVFEKKLGLFAEQLFTFDKAQSFQDNLAEMIGTHFDFLRENPNLLMFVVNEATGSESQLGLIRRIVQPKIERICKGAEAAIEREKRAGRLSGDISINNLLLDIISLNALSIGLLGKWQEVGIISKEQLDARLTERREHIKELIIGSLEVKENRD